MHENDYFYFAIRLPNHGFPDHRDYSYLLRWLRTGYEDSCEQAIGYWAGLCGWEEDDYGDGGDCESYGVFEERVFRVALRTVDDMVLFRIYTLDKPCLKIVLRYRKCSWISISDAYSLPACYWCMSILGEGPLFGPIWWEEVKMKEAMSATYVPD